MRLCCTSYITTCHGVCKVVPDVCLEQVGQQPYRGTAGITLLTSMLQASLLVCMMEHGESPVFSSPVEQLPVDSKGTESIAKHRWHDQPRVVSGSEYLLSIYDEGAT